MSAKLGMCALALGAAVCGMHPGAGVSPQLPAPGCADSALRLDLNLPSFRLDVRSTGGSVAIFKVAIGARKYRTPVGRFAVTSVEWNPWWIPPKSEWARKDTVTPPGPKNPMGRVKLWFGPMYFLHGSPAAQSIGHAASHGCVRLRNGDAMDLASLLLTQPGSGLDAAAVAAMRADTQVTRTIALARPVTLTLRYEVVEWRDDTLWVFPDVYRRGAPTTGRALRVLAAAGFDTTRVQRARLRAVVRRGGRSATGIPAADLMASPASGSVSGNLQPDFVRR